MPKVDGLDKIIRVAMLNDALADEGSAPIDLPPSPASVPAPTQTLAPDTTTLIQMLASAIAQSGSMQADSLKDALRDQASMARTPIAETYLSGGYPNRGVFNHPQGGEHNTPLRCPMFLGVYNERGQVTAAFEEVGGNCREDERVLLNQLRPGQFWLERNDGIKAICRVVEERDDLGQPIRVIVAVPQTWLSKSEQAQMPHLRNRLTQLTAPAA